VPDLVAVAPASERVAMDDELGMMFLCCHPALPRDAQVAMVLKTVGGLGVKEIARAYLTQESTIAQRLVRAKRQIREEGIAFDLPEALAGVEGRLDGVLESLYLLFNEGYSLRAHEVSEEAIRLGRLLVRSPATALPKCHALLSLLLLQSARDRARIDADGALLILEQQDRSLWDQARMGEGMRHLDLAATGSELTRYHVEAGIASIHATAGSWEATSWVAIERQYELLEQLHPSPVVRLNRAIAASKARGPQEGLALLEGAETQLAGYAPFHGALGLFHEQLGELGRAEFQYGLALRHSPGEPEQRYLRKRMQTLGEIRMTSTNIH
jgi:RNA polymerase sigma-70 factor, ECF subfamily